MHTPPLLPKQGWVLAAPSAVGAETGTLGNLVGGYSPFSLFGSPQGWYRQTLAPGRTPLEDAQKQTSPCAPA